MPVPISGSCDARFRHVHDEFMRNFSERGEVGAGLCVLIDGRSVVDLVGGWTDRERRRPWRPDTLVNFYSVGKAFVALLALRLLDRGLIELDEPVASIWPEFGDAGKDAATLRHALSHQAGVPAIRQPLTNADLWDWNRMAGALAASEPWWEPGTRHAYHTNTYGHLIGEIVRPCRGEHLRWKLWRRSAGRSVPTSGSGSRRMPPIEMCGHPLERLGERVDVDFGALKPVTSS
jgi:CubicO group peptidase (beta-lactamase class C family)